MAGKASTVCYLAISTWLVCSIASLPFEQSAFPSSGLGRYSGYRVLQLQFSSQGDAISSVRELSASFQLDVWGRSFNGTVDVMVAPEDIDDVTKFVTSRGASCDVIIDNVQSLLEGSMHDLLPSHRRRRSSRMLTQAVALRYFRFRQIRQYLRQVRASARHADVIVSSLGRSFERRPTPFVTIRQRGSRDVNKRVVVIEAGMHAREWVAPAMALNIINKLALNPDNDSDVTELLRRFDWVIIPVANPDGYIYSMRDMTTRLWRKTRTNLYAAGVTACYGVDGNRNFGFQWRDTHDRGGSSNPCDDIYSGPQGFSEPETRNVRSLLLRMRGRIGLFISLHSFGQFFLYPWGYDSSAVLEDEEDMMEIAQQFADVMLQRNRWYETGTSARVLYPAAGASDDFAKGGAGVKYAFTIELSPSDASHYAFLLPARLISRVVEDHWPAFKAIALTISDRLNETDHLPTTTTTTTTPPSSNAEAVNNNNKDDDDNNNYNSGVDNSTPADEGEENGNRNSASGGNGSERRLTEVTIDGHTFRLDLNDPAVAQWMEYYMQLLHYRSYYPS